MDNTESKRGGATAVTPSSSGLACWSAEGAGTEMKWTSGETKEEARQGLVYMARGDDDHRIIRRRIAMITKVV